MIIRRGMGGVLEDAEAAARAAGLDVDCRTERITTGPFVYEQNICSAPGFGEGFSADLIARPGGAQILAAELQSLTPGPQTYFERATEWGYAPTVVQTAAPPSTPLAAPPAVKTPASIPPVPAPATSANDIVKAQAAAKESPPVPSSYVPVGAGDFDEDEAWWLTTLRAVRRAVTPHEEGVLRAEGGQFPWLLAAAAAAVGVYAISRKGPR